MFIEMVTEEQLGHSTMSFKSRTSIYEATVKAAAGKQAHPISTAKANHFSPVY